MNDPIPPHLPLVALVVTYQPDLKILGQLVDQCATQVDGVVLVDNDDGARLSAWLAQRADANVALLPLGGNKGIAAAQNAGIAWARSRGAEHIILFDHDSVPPDGLTAHLLAALADLERQGKKVAAIGPRWVDSRWNKGRVPSPFSRFQKWRFAGCYPENNSRYVAVDYLIASGTLIPMTALDAVGGMTDELFIDFVDIDWGSRARQAGWELYGVWDIVMEHGIGDDRIVVFGRGFPMHSALRHYYAMRNAVWMCTRSKLSGKRRFAIGYSAMLRFVAYSLFMPKPLEHVRKMCLGLWHGMIGRMGRL
jgi:rhamnosyltransferase